MTIPLNGSSAYDLDIPPRPKDVGILAMEMYVPRRVSNRDALVLPLHTL